MNKQRERKMRLLKAKIQLHETTQVSLAEKLGITGVSMSNKMRGTQPFKVDEIRKLRALLQLTPAEVCEIFIDEMSEE